MLHKKTQTNFETFPKPPTLDHMGALFSHKEYNANGGVNVLSTLVLNS